jgi:hypothetical protein
MKPWRFTVAVAVTWILTDIADFFARLGRGFLAHLGRIFGTGRRNPTLLAIRIPLMRRKCNRYLARLARVELSAARDLGTFATELLREGRQRVARNAAREAYLHWQKARKVFARLLAAA